TATMPAAHAAAHAEAYAVAARLAFFALVASESFVAPESLVALEPLVALGAAHDHASSISPRTCEDGAERLPPSHAEVSAVRPAAVATDRPAAVKPIVVPTQSVVTPLRLRARRRDD